MLKISDVFDNLELEAGVQEHLLLHKDEYMAIDGRTRESTDMKAPLLTLDENELNYNRTESTKSNTSHVL